jgi:hypothetical protein
VSLCSNSYIEKRAKGEELLVLAEAKRALLEGFRDLMVREHWANGRGCRHRLPILARDRACETR